MKLKRWKMTVMATMAGLLACAGNLTPRAVADDEVLPENVLDFVAGGGWIVGTPTGGRATFGIVAGVATNSVATNTFLFGSFCYQDRGSQLRVKSTDIAAFTVVDAQTRQIEFNVTINGAPGTATVIVSDQGEPGINDTFNISLSNSYTAAGLLGGGHRGGGNIQLNPPQEEDEDD